MSGMERRPIGSEQLVPLWTWLLEGYLPVAHIVADLDELETSESNDSTDGLGGGPFARSRPQD